MTEIITFLDRATIQKDIVLRKPDFPHKWINYEETNSEQVVERLAGTSIAVVNKINISEQVLSQCPDIKMIASAATGIDNIDLEACKKRNIVVSNIRNYATVTVAEHVLSMVFALRRELLQYRQEVIDGRWQRSAQFCFFDKPINDLASSVIGIIGFGSLGQAVAKLAHALGMQVIFTARSEKQCDFAAQVDLQTLFETSDVISCHCPKTPDTINLLDETAFKQMKKTAIVINTARGNIVDEQALAKAIIDQEIAGAGIDVLAEEPPAPDNPLLKIAHLSNVIITPHTAWASMQAMQILADQLVDNIEAFMRGEPQNCVIV